MNFDAPMISVCMTTFNGENFILNQLQSILPQLRETDEVIISDNGSTDRTIQIIHGVNDSRIILKHFDQKNIPNNFQNSIRCARGEIIILSDQDDIWLDGRVQAAIDGLKTCDLAVVSLIYVDEALKPVAMMNEKIPTPSNSVTSNILANSYIGCCMAFNRKILEAIIPFPEKLPMHDWWIGLIACAIGKTSYNSKPFILYRRHSFNVSSTGNLSKNTMLFKLLMRARLVSYLLVRLFKIWFNNSNSINAIPR